MRISDWSSDVCSSDLPVVVALVVPAPIVTLPRSFCWTLVESGPCARTGPASAKTNERKSAAILISSPHGVAAGFLLQRARSEEHTSELQSLMRISYAVFCLTKKNRHKKHQTRPLQICEPRN